MCDTLIFKGAGTKGVSYIGVIRYFEEIGKINQVKVYSGSSSGSFICLLASLGYTSHEMLDEFVQTNIKEMFGGASLSKTILTSWRSFGMTDGKAFEEKIKTLIARKVGNPLITFLELYQLTGKTLIVTGACLNTNLTEYFNWKTTPNFPVYFALRISQSLPPIVAPVIITVRRHYLPTEGPYTESNVPPEYILVEDLLSDSNELICRNYHISDLLPEMDTFEKWYVDGGLLDNYPVEYTCKFTGTREATVGFDIDTLRGGNPRKNNYHTITRRWPWDYIKSIIFAQHIELERASRSFDDLTVPIIVADIDVYNFDLTSLQAQQLYQDGYTSVKNYYHNRTCSEPDVQNPGSDDELESRINVVRKPSQPPKQPCQPNLNIWE